MSFFKIEHLESAVKFVTFAGVGCTICGYVIVSLYEAKYGFVLSNPFKPRMVSAGLLFGFVSYAIYLCAFEGFTLGTRVEKGYADWKAMDEGASGLIAACVVLPHRLSQLAFGISAGFAAFLRIVNWSGTTMSNSGWKADFGGLFFAVIGVVLSTLSLTRGWRKRVVILSSIVTLLMAFALVCCQILAFKANEEEWRIWLYFAGYCGIAFLLLGTGSLTDDKKKFLVRNFATSTNYVYPLLMLLSFARSVYPYVDSAWGGGKPTPIVITFTSNSPAPGQSFRRLLIEENDAGLYVVQNPASRAHFIPRANIALIAYGD